MYYGLQKDKSNAEDALQKERKKLDAWKRKVVEQNEKEQEAGDLHQQLSELQVSCILISSLTLTLTLIPALTRILILCGV